MVVKDNLPCNSEYVNIEGRENMKNSKYVIFNIWGVKQNGSKYSLKFSKDAECAINNDQFISQIVVSSDISSTTFYLHDSLDISENNVSEIINYLFSYLSSMMISLVKNSSCYPNVSLKPTISVSVTQLLGNRDLEVCCS